MPRKINSSLISRLLDKNDLSPILSLIKDPKSNLRLEIRHGNIDVYHRKALFFKIKPKAGIVNGAEKYNLPSNELASTNPKEYVSKGKEAIDNWSDNNKDRDEFDSQQNIALHNQNDNDKYIILDMEYSFERISRAEKLISIDLVGIERLSGKVVLFELKTGLGAIAYKSGIDEHITDYESYLCGDDKEHYKTNLLNDVRNTLKNKIELGLISEKGLLERLVNDTPEFKFIFHPKSSLEIPKFKETLKGRKELIIVKDDNYKLY